LTVEALENRSVPSSLPLAATHAVVAPTLFGDFKRPATTSAGEAGVAAHARMSVPQHPHSFVAKFQDRSVTPLVAEGSVATLRGTIVDGDPNGVFLLSVDWGDSTPVQHFVFDPKVTSQVELTHRYTKAGDFTIHLVWRDARGPENTADLSIVVRA
jgi:hypothetical protein